MLALHASSNLPGQNRDAAMIYVNVHSVHEWRLHQCLLDQNSMMQSFVWLQVGGVLAELQAEQARLRQLCSEQAAAMHSLQRQAQQAAK